MSEPSLTPEEAVALALLSARINFPLRLELAARLVLQSLAICGYAIVPADKQTNPDKQCQPKAPAAT